MSMAESLEVRVPFLDHELVELCAKIPGSLKLHGRTEKYVLRQAMKPLLPPEIAGRKKRWLRAPNAAWLRGELPPFAETMLSETRLKDNGYFNPAVVRRYLDAQRRGDLRHTRALMAVLCVQTWNDVFVRGCRPGSRLLL
jgi:asparagine synthase (glutamine-hydrolysing)